MNWSMFQKDLKKNKVVNLTILVFMTLSFFLAATALLISNSLISSIQSLYQIAQPPQFLQMHKGDIELDKLNKFNETFEGISYFQVVTMIDILGEDITVKKEDETISLNDFKLDIGLVKQNKERDLLLDNNKQVVHLNAGEIAVPKILKKNYHIKLGDTILLKRDGIKQEFIVKEFIVDAQMNSTMASSIRILISDEDFANLEHKIGEREHLIEVYFDHPDRIKEYKAAYEAANIYTNGQSVTYTIIFLLSAITDLTTVFILLLSSFLLIIIAITCIRFLLISTMEEEIKEIGIMKAIGIPTKQIKQIYRFKYLVFAFISFFAGYLIAIGTSYRFLSHIRETFGQVSFKGTSYLYPFLACLFVFLILLISLNQMLKQMNQLSIVDAIHGRKKQKRHWKLTLKNYKKLSTMSFLSLNDLFVEFKKWKKLLFVVVIANLIVLIPLNVLNTMNSKAFIRYMGHDLEDILISVENTEAHQGSIEQLNAFLSKSNQIDHYNLVSRFKGKAYDSENKIKTITIDVTDQLPQKLNYLEGKSPSSLNEIALSYLNSTYLNKKVGDFITISFVEGEKNFKISGIYQDVTSGGYTAKSIYPFVKEQADSYTYSVSVKKESSIQKVVSYLASNFQGFKVYKMDEFLKETLGEVLSSMRLFLLLIEAINIAILVLITVLFLRLILVQDKEKIAVLKSIGFSNSSIRKQYHQKILIVSVLAIAISLFLSFFLGQIFTNLVLQLSNLGIVKINFIFHWNSLIVFVLTIIVIQLVTYFICQTVEYFKMDSIQND